MDGVEADEANHDEVDGDHEIQETRHDEDHDSRDQSHGRTDLGVAELHKYLLSWDQGLNGGSRRGFHRRQATLPILGFALV